MSILLPATPSRSSRLFPLYVFYTPDRCMIIASENASPCVVELSDGEKKELDENVLRLVSLREWRDDWKKSHMGGRVPKVCELPFGYESGDTIAVWYDDLLPLIPDPVLSRCMEKAEKIVSGEILSQEEHDRIMSDTAAAPCKCNETGEKDTLNTNSDFARAKVLSETMHIIYDEEPEALLPVYYLLSRKNLRDLPATPEEACKR